MEWHLSTGKRGTDGGCLEIICTVIYLCNLKRRDNVRKIANFICSSKVDCYDEDYESFLDGLFHRDDFINPIMLIKTPPPPLHPP